MCDWLSPAWTTTCLLKTGHPDRKRMSVERSRVMKQDPVCGMQVEEQKAAGMSTHEGQKYYFCSLQCKEKFDRNPQQYARPEQFAHQGGQQPSMGKKK